MSHKSKKAAPEATSEESVTTKSAESQEQPTTTPDGSSAGNVPAVAGAKATTTGTQSNAVTNGTSEVLQGSKMLPEEKQYLTAIGMKDDQLGEVIKKPTERINKRVGNAMAHEAEAKEERSLAQKEFVEHIAYYYEAKQRLLSPKYRPDLNTGKERTEEDNLRNFGAKDWQQFNANCMAYSLQHANEKLKAFAKAQGRFVVGEAARLHIAPSAYLVRETAGCKLGIPPVYTASTCTVSSNNSGLSAAWRANFAPKRPTVS